MRTPASAATTRASPTACARSIAPAVKIHIYIADDATGRMPVNLRLR